MKNLILLFAILFAIVSCSKDDDSQSNNSRIVIKGSISGSNLKSTELKSVNQLSLTDAKKVLVFNSNSYSVYNIEDGSFTAEAASGTACAFGHAGQNDHSAPFAILVP